MLKAHFLNVGKGNCTIIEFPSGRLTMIDIDNSRVNDDNPLTDPMDYYINKFGRKALFRFILSHPDMDHMSGLNLLANEISILNFWDTENNKIISDEDWDNSPYDRDDWKKYQEFRRSEEDPKCLFLYQNSESECCWTQDGITILSPTEKLVELANETGEYNHLSYVLMVTYSNLRVLIGGDATIEAWDEIFKKFGVDGLRANIFLAPHHGSKNNINKDVFEYINPDYVIVSVAEGVDYDYNYYNKLAKKSVLSTKYYGTITLEIRPNGKYQIFVERNA